MRLKLCRYAFSPPTFVLAAAFACLAVAGPPPLAAAVTVASSVGVLGYAGRADLSATVTGGGTVQSVDWSRNPTLGTVVGNGLTAAYVAPASFSATFTIVITARVTFADGSTDSGSTSITLQPNVSVSISPSGTASNPLRLSAGQSTVFTATVNNAPPGLGGVVWALNPSGAGTLTGSGLSAVYTAPASIASTQTVSISASSVADITVFASASVSLEPSGVYVTVSPSSATLSAGGTRQFTATVGGVVNQEVTWSLNPNVGSISSTGLYTAPSVISTAQTVTVIATSAADRMKSGTSTVTLSSSSSAGISVTPKTATLTAGQSQQFTAAVTGVSNVDVNWSISPPNQGSIAASGTGTAVYTAPSPIPGNSTVTVTATSVADPNKTATATVTLSAQTTALDVGTGAPNDSIRQLFVQAFYRNGFQNLVSLPPIGQVRRISGPNGTFGYVQEFNDAAKTSGVRLALIKVGDGLSPISEDTPLVFQIHSPLYVYYSSVGSATAGFPTMDSEPCPSLDGNSCEWALFSNNYALFAYASALATGQNFAIRQNFYTKWTAMGGLNGVGRPVDVETTVTSSFGTAATVQTYSGGAIYNFTTGVMNGQTWGVAQPIYGLYLASGGPTASLGFPTGNEIVLTSGVHRQAFQGGAIDWNPGSDPSLRWPVASVALAGPGASSGTLRMNYGDTVSVAATVFSTTGAELQDRAVSWTTSNSRVAAFQQTGAAAVIKAVGGGSALITASSEGKVSKALSVIVTAPCCMVGEGPVSSDVQQAFADAVRGLPVQLPAADPVTRIGAGYVQPLQSADPAAPATWLVCKADNLGTAYIVTAGILDAYQALGGPAGELGYPASAVTPGGRQMFAGGAIAGSPPVTVTGPVLAKWALLGYETGAAGSPLSSAAAFSTFGANAGSVQAFSGGSIYAATAGPRTGQTWFVSGPILDRYLASGGPEGDFGMPASDEFASGTLRQQNFEGGSIDYTAGQPATAHPAERKPAIAVSPVAVVPGGRVRLAALGFPSGATLRVSITGQPDFLVRVANGAFTWEVLVPAGAAPGTVLVRAADTAGTGQAQASYTVRTYADSGARLAIVRGDGQTGAPGALLPKPLRVALRDSAGSPVAGVPVLFEASPGAQVSPATATTDGNGEAGTWLRLAASEGLVNATATAPAASMAAVTFGALAKLSSLANFPALRQAGDVRLGNGPGTVADKGALLAAVASVLRYHQNRGELPAPNGPADVPSLNRFLTEFCATTSTGDRLCDGFLSESGSGEQVMNLWRAGEFAGGGVDVSVESTSPDDIRDLIAQGSPVLLSLALTAGGAPAGGHFVVVTGISADSTLAIHDPSPQFARAALSDYINGFSAVGALWKGELRGALRLLPRAPAGSRFLLASVSQPAAIIESLALEALSAAGPCGRALYLQDAAVPGAAGASAPRATRLLACDGASPLYQLSLGLSQPWHATVTDLAAGGSAISLAAASPVAYQATRPRSALVLAPETAQVSAVVNAADLGPGLAPGGLLLIRGAGLAAGENSVALELDDMGVQVTAAAPFQLTAVMPSDAAAGPHTLRVRAPFGVVEYPVDIQRVAPAIFLDGAGAPTVFSQNGKRNTATNPAIRGQNITVYCTGLGVVVSRAGRVSPAEPVAVVLNGQVLQPASAVLSADLPGVYVVTVQIPAAAPPGAAQPLLLRQGGVDTGTVPVSIQ